MNGTTQSFDAFISYAREDAPMARRIRNVLVRYGVKVFFDKDDLRPGERWKSAIRKAIRNSEYFFALLSSASVLKRGYVQKELREALDVLDEHPDDGIFVIPVRLEECEPSHHALRELNWVDIFVDFNAGIAQVLRLIDPKAAIIFEIECAREAPIDAEPRKVGGAFAAALQPFPSSVRTAVENRLSILGNSSAVARRVVNNLSREEDLPQSAWYDLIQNLVDAEPDVESVRKALIEACQRNQLRGKRIVNSANIVLSAVTNTHSLIRHFFIAYRHHFLTLSHANDFVDRLLRGVEMDSAELEILFTNFNTRCYFNPSGGPAIPQGWSAARLSCVLGRDRRLTSSLIVIDYQPPSINLHAATVCDVYASPYWDYDYEVRAPGELYGRSAPRAECAHEPGLPEVVHAPLKLKYVQSVRLLT